jgi:hypothetical protein
MCSMETELARLGCTRVWSSIIGRKFSVISPSFLLASQHFLGYNVHKNLVGRLGKTVRLNPNKRFPCRSRRPYPKNLK